jgi:hypothetical protein
MKVGQAAEGDEGYLIYLKPSLKGDEEADLLRHHVEHDPFPHDPTLDQLFDPDMVESYRQLGYHIGESLCKKLTVGGEFVFKKRKVSGWDAFEAPLDQDEIKSIVSAVARSLLPSTAPLAPADKAAALDHLRQSQDAAQPLAAEQELIERLLRGVRQVVKDEKERPNEQENTWEEP